MKKLLYFSFFIFNSSFCFGQEWCWGDDGRVNYKSNDYCSPVATNRFGNAYTTGQFENFIIFGDDTLTDLHDNTFIVKYNSRGVVQWAKNPVSSGDETSFGYAVVSDAEDNAYIAGTSDSTLKFGPYTITSGFLVKYGPTGQVLWADNYGGYALAMDKNGNICLASGSGLKKFNSNGTLYMTKSTSYDLNGITTDNLLNIYATGIQDTNGGFSSAQIPYIAKFDSSGNLLWEHQPTIATFACEGNGTSVITDKAGNVYFTGYFHDTLYFGPYTLIAPNFHTIFGNEGYGLFLVKYDANGKLVWAKQNTDHHKWRGTSLAKDSSNAIYMGGSGIDADSLTFGGGMLTFTPSSSSADASFIMRLDTAGRLGIGSLLKHGTFNYQPEDFSNEIAVDSTGRYSFLTGAFQSDTIFCANDTLFDGAGQATYIARWSWIIPGCYNGEDAIPQVSSTQPSVILYPNPNGGRFSIEMKNEELRMNNTIEIYNILGEKVYSNSYQPLSNSQQLISINLNQPSGMYLYRIISENGELIGDGKFIIK